jgi:autoinducer 2-degrading protein
MSDTSQLTAFCVYLKVTPGREAAFLAESRKNQAGARAEPGNLRFEIYRSQENPRNFLFAEEYISVEAVAQHRETPHFKAWLETAGPMLAEPRERVGGTVIPPGYERVDP